MNRYYEIWIEGYAATGESGRAYKLCYDGDPNTVWKGCTFQHACVRALNELKWPMLYTALQGLGTCYYDAKTNSYWGRKFYDNEEDARKSFG